MARTTANVLALLEILQRGGSFTAADLADRIEVDERTVRRYITHLVDLEIPVWSERGRYGGYRLAPGYRMPPLMLTDDEAVAVILALTTARVSGSISHATMATEAAIAKIRRILPEPLGERVDDLLMTVAATSRRSTRPPTEVSILLTFAEAARGRHPVEFDYTDRHGRSSRRTLHPMGIVAHDGRWYATGRDPVQSETRTFRLDRVSEAGVIDGSFEPTADARTPDALIDGFADVAYRHEAVIVVDGPPADVRNRLPRTIATVEPVDAGDRLRTRVRIRADTLDWIPALIASLDVPFVIERPDELRDLVRRHGRRLIDCADTT